MNKFKKSQLLILSLLTILLIIAPLLSSSLRPTYIYFITNLLIIALGAEAGLLSFFSKPSSDINNNDQKKNPQTQLANGSNQQEKVDLDHSSDYHKKVNNNNNNTNIRVAEKSLSVKIVGSVKVEKVKKCPSMPSLFFIGTGGDTNNEGDNSFCENYFYDDDDDDDDDEEEEEEKKEVGEISGQELFAKAENFIGNFYNQLKMQREESWKRIHGFYQRAF